MSKSKAMNRKSVAAVRSSERVRRRLNSDIMWAVAMPDHKDDTRLTLYTGTWLTRRDAIKDHTEAKGWSWERCRRNGDVAVRVKVSAA